MECETMANVVEDDKVAIGECEATVIIRPEDFFKLTPDLFGDQYKHFDWAQAENRPDHIKGTADWAVYPTRHYNPTIRNLETMVAKAGKHGITLGRNQAQKDYLRQFLNGSLTIANIGDFDASTKPVSPSSLPYWWFVRSEKDELGKDVTVKTLRLENYDDIQRLQTASGALMTDRLNSGQTIGVVYRIIIKYQLKVGENAQGDICVPADFRADRVYQLSKKRKKGAVLEISQPTYITSVECELKAEGADPLAIQRGIETIYGTLRQLGGVKTNLRFGALSLAKDPRTYVQRRTEGLARLDPSEFSQFYDAMQQDGARIWEEYAKAPDAINRQVEPANRSLMAELQRADRF